MGMVVGVIVVRGVTVGIVVVGGWWWCGDCDGVGIVVVWLWWWRFFCEGGFYCCHDDICCDDRCWGIF